MPTVHFLNDHKSLDVLPGANLRKAALKSGIRLYRPLYRLLHMNISIGPLNVPCASDVVEIVDGKGLNPRTPDEETLLSGRFLKRKVTPNLRLACQIEVNGDITVKTLPVRELDQIATKRSIGLVGLVTVFLLLMLAMFGMMALDMINKL